MYEAVSKRLYDTLERRRGERILRGGQPLLKMQEEGV
jgi:hypothetical protein